MTKHLIPLTFFALLTGCVTTKEIYGPNGQKAYTLNCSDSTSANWDDCYEKAGEICRENGYIVLEEQTDTEASGNWGDGLFGQYSKGNNRVMMIQCKNSERQKIQKAAKLKKPTLKYATRTNNNQTILTAAPGVNGRPYPYQSQVFSSCSIREAI